MLTRCGLVAAWHTLNICCKLSTQFDDYMSYKAAALPIIHMFLKCSLNHLETNLSAISVLVIALGLMTYSAVFGGYFHSRDVSTVRSFT